MLNTCHTFTAQNTYGWRANYEYVDHMTCGWCGWMVWWIINGWSNGGRRASWWIHSQFSIQRQVKWATSTNLMWHHIRYPVRMYSNIRTLSDDTPYVTCAPCLTTQTCHVTCTYAPRLTTQTHQVIYVRTLSDDTFPLHDVYAPCLTNVWLTSSKMSQPSTIILSIARFLRMFSVSLTSSCIICKQTTFTCTWR